MPQPDFRALRRKFYGTRVLYVAACTIFYAFLHWYSPPTPTWTLFAVWSFYTIWANWSRGQVPIPGPSFPLKLVEVLIGVFLITFKERHRLYDWLVEQQALYGQTWMVSKPLAPDVIVLSEANCVDHILRRNFDNYVKGPDIQQVMDPFLGNGIFNVNGELWASQRKTAAHLFRTNNLKAMLPVFKSHAQHACERVEALSDGEVIDVQELFASYTLDSIMEIAFGTSSHLLGENYERFRDAFNSANVCTGCRFRAPEFPILNAVGLAGFLPTEKQLVRDMAVINELAYKVIAERRGQSDYADRPDLLSRYMTMRDDDDQPFSDVYLRDIVLSFFLAGRDTTAQTSSWMTYELARNPDVRAKIIAEMDEVIGDEQDVTYEHIRGLKYMEHVMNEVLRLWPPVPFDPKYSLKDDMLPNGTFVPAHTTIAWSAWLMGRSDEYFDEPLEFRPERWMDPKHNGGIVIPSIASIPFQAGPRLCLGQRMAYQEVKLLMVTLLRRPWFLNLAPQQLKQIPPKYLVGLTLQARDGILMVKEDK